MGQPGDYDFIITEIGGTVGDIEGLPFLEAIRQLKWELGRDAVCVHLTYVPYIAAVGELKTKPSKHSVKELQGLGLQPDALVLRTERELGCWKIRFVWIHSGYTYRTANNGFTQNAGRTEIFFGSFL